VFAASTEIDDIVASPDARLILTRSHVLPVNDDPYYRACVLDAAGRPLEKFDLPGDVLAAAFSPDGRLLATGGLYGAIRLWATDTGEEVLPVKGHHGPVLSVAFSPDGARLASSGHDDRVIVWNVANGRPSAELSARSVYARNLTQFIANGEKIVVAGGRRVEIWPWKRRAPALSVPLAEDTIEPFFQIQALACAADQLFLGLRNAPNFSLDWDPEMPRSRMPTTLLVVDNRKKRRLKNAAAEDIDFDDVWSVAVSPDARYLAVGGSKLRVLATNDLGILNTMRLSGRQVYALAFSRSSRFLAVGDGAAGALDAYGDRYRAYRALSRSSHITIWSLADHKVLCRIPARPGTIFAVAFSPDDRVIASAGDSDSIWLWEAGSGRQLGAIKHPQCRINALCFSPDGKLLASAGDDGTVLLWNARNAIEAGSAEAP
jgi:WD40 repeat protein